MKTSEQDIEKEIQAKGLTAPRLTPQNIDGTISYKNFYRGDNTTTTICAIILNNGYTVVGKAAAVSMANFDQELGEKIAFEDARNQIWALEGYCMKGSALQNA